VAGSGEVYIGVYSVVEAYYVRSVRQRQKYLIVAKQNNTTS